MEEMMDGIGLVRIRRPFSGTRRRTAKQILETCRGANVEWESPSSNHRWNSDSQLAKSVDAVIHNWSYQCSYQEQFCAYIYDRSHLLPYAKEGNGKHKNSGSRC